MSFDPFLNMSLDQGGPALPALKEGMSLFNRRYELVRPLGAGGMGVVWLARDHTEHSNVALKFLPTVLARQEDEMQSLRDEVRAGKELRHPGIVATYGLEVENAMAAIVMEHVAGKTLKDLLKAQPRGFFEPEEIRGWVRHVGEALHYLHTKARRIHRDVKPANIMVDDQGEARLMDFGLSQRLREGLSLASRAGDAPAGSSGTLVYASPEQLAGRLPAEADDIYAFGATLYDLLTGTPPFYRGGAEAVVHQIKHEPVMLMMERRAELLAARQHAGAGRPIPPAIEKMVAACLAKTREARPATAGQVAEAFIPTASPNTRPAKKTVPPAKPGTSGGLPQKEGSRTVPLRKKEIPTTRKKTPPPPATPQPEPESWRFLIFSALGVIIVGGGVLLFSSPPAKTAAPSYEEVQASEYMQRVQEQVREVEAAAKNRRLPTESSPPSLPETSRLAAQAQAAAGKPPTGTTTTALILATLKTPYVNSLGMRFVPTLSHTLIGEQKVLFSVWETCTQDYAAFVKDSGYNAGSDWQTATYKNNPVGRDSGTPLETSTHPVVCVSKKDAEAFCEWLTKKEQAEKRIGFFEQYRLPTDSEWSTAIGLASPEKGDSPSAKSSSAPNDIFPWGKTFPPPRNVGNYDYALRLPSGKINPSLVSATLLQDKYPTTAPVGMFGARDNALCDMGGNVWEWTSSAWDASSPRFALRGGSWQSTDGTEFLSAHRLSAAPDERKPSYGFRCVLETAQGDLLRPTFDFRKSSKKFQPQAASPQAAPFAR